MRVGLRPRLLPLLVQHVVGTLLDRHGIVEELRFVMCPEHKSTGQPVLVPGDMGTGSWLLAGPKQGMNEAFGSSCHGAGRRLSRAAARAQVDVPALMAQLSASGVHLKHGTERGLAEEAPEAYKPVDDVVDATEDAGLARRVAKLSPRVVVKG